MFTLKKISLAAHKGSAALTATMIAAALTSIIGLASVKMSSATMSSVNAIKVADQAEEYARAQAGLIRATKYSDLTSKNKTAINSTNFYYEILLGEESDYDTKNSIKQRLMTVNVYNGNESVPIYSLNIPRYSKELDYDEIPVGSIQAWAGSSSAAIPTGWLLCDGSAKSSTTYKELYKVIGTTYGGSTSSFNLPNLQNTFIEGTALTSEIGLSKDATKLEDLGQHTHAVGVHHFNNGGFYIYNNTSVIGSKYTLGSQAAGIQHYNGSGGDNGRSNYSDKNTTMYNLNSNGNMILTSPAVYDISGNIQPKSVVMRYIIKY